MPFHLPLGFILTLPEYINSWMHHFAVQISLYILQSDWKEISPSILLQAHVHFLETAAFNLIPSQSQQYFIDTSSTLSYTATIWARSWTFPSFYIDSLGCWLLSPYFWVSLRSTLSVQCYRTQIRSFSLPPKILTNLMESYHANSRTPCAGCSEAHGGSMRQTTFLWTQLCSKVQPLNVHSCQGSLLL